MNALQSRLATLRRRLRLVVIARGLSLLLIAFLGGAALASVLDWSVHLPGLVRAVLLVAILGGSGYLAHRFLLAPLQGKADDLTLALRVEAAYPVLNDALASTVQFLEQPTDSDLTGSPSLRREAVQRALRMAQGCDFNKILDTRGLRLAGLAAVVVLGLAVFLCVWTPALALTALLRLADPYNEHDWPRDTRLTLDFRNRAAMKQKYVIRGEVGGVIPARAVIEFEGLAPNKEVKEYPIETREGAETGSFSARVDLTRQNRPFRFRVRANDAASPAREGAWHTVTVSQPPRLVALNGLPTPQVELHYPPYTDLPSPLKLSPGAGQVEAVAGTRVLLRAATDRAISQAWIAYRPGNPYAIEAVLAGPVGSRSALGAAGLVVGGRELWDRVPARLEAGGRQFAVEFQPWVSGAYVLHLEDDEGLPSEYEFDLRVLADPVPVVQLERPSGNQSVLPDAELTLQAVAEDEMFAVRSAHLEYRRKDKDGNSLDREPGRVPLYDSRVVAESLPPLLAGLAVPLLPAPLPELRLRPKRLQLSQRWSLEGLGREGDILTIQVCADDFNDVIGHNVPGRSHEVELRIVGKAALAAVLDDAQAKIQQELLRLREWQEKALKKVIEAEQQWRTTGQLRPEDFDKLVEAEQLQKQIQARVGATKDGGIREELRRLEQTMRDNKLPPSGTEDRLKAMKAELERLAQEHLPQIEPRLTSARQKLADAKAKVPADRTKGDLGKAREHQEEVQQSLDELLKYLERWASTQEIKGETRAVLQEQRDLQAETEKLNKTFVKGEEQSEAALRRIAELQRRLADKTQRLLDKMERVAQERADKDRASKEMLEKAAQIGKDELLPGEMKDVAEEQLLAKDDKSRESRPQINRAIGQQGMSIKTLDKMVAAMEERREAEIERLVKKQREEQKNLDDLVERLQKLQKKVEAARKDPDPEKRKAELKKLADEQRQLEEEIKKKGRELARLQAPQAGKDLARAAQKLERAARQLDDGEDPEEAQQEALERLEQAQDELKEAREEAEEELAREQLARIADQIKPLKERQDAAIEESGRIHQAMLKKSGWERGLVESLRSHGKAQAGLGKETDNLAEKLKGAKVFGLILKKSAQAMESAATNIAERQEKARDRQGIFPLAKEEMEDEDRADAQTRKLQQEASHRLQRLLDALKQEPGVAQKPRKDDQGGDDGGQPKARGGGDGIPALAQLKALRAEQQEVNDRTRAIAEAKQKPENLPPAQRAELEKRQRAELEAIHAEQEEVFRLFRELTTAANEGGKE